MSELYTLTKDFCNVIFSKNPTKLDEWINAAQKYDIPELQTFMNGIKKDITAVKNGIIYSYNNGLAEGNVNKITTTGLAGGLLCGYKPLFLLASKEALNSPPSALRSQAWL